MTRTSSIAIVLACGAMLLGSALIGATMTLAGEAKPQPVAQPARSAAPAPDAAKPADSVAEAPRRAVRVVYVGPITAR